MYLILIFMSFFTYLLADSCSREVNMEEKLKQDILCNYNAYEGPIKNSISQSMNVEISFKPKSLSMMLGRNIYAFVSINLASINIIKNYNLINKIQNWKDEHAKWDPNDYNGLKDIVIPSTSVWKPTLFALNNVYSSSKMNMDVYTVMFKYNGEASMFLNQQFYSYCSVEISKWPNDGHTCNLELQSHASSVLWVNLTLAEKPLNMSSYQKNKEWDLSGVDVKRSEIKNGGNTTVKIICQLKLKRHSNSLTSTTLAPIGVSVFLLLLSFWIHPLDSFRFILLIVIFGIHIAYLIFVGNKIPKGVRSANIFIITFLQNSLIMCFIAIVQLRVTKTILLSSGIPRIIQIIRTIVDKQGWTTILLLPQKTENGEESKQELMITAVLFDRLSFILFVLIYLLIFVFLF